MQYSNKSMGFENRQLGVVAHACDPSTLRGLDGRITRAMSSTVYFVSTKKKKLLSMVAGTCSSSYSGD